MLSRVTCPNLEHFNVIVVKLFFFVYAFMIFPGVDTMEKGALVGMMALAASDFLFCVVTIAGTYLPPQLTFYKKDFIYYYTLYGNFIQNTLIKTSTWFTVILAVSRYVVVSNPIRARQYMRCIHTVIAILTCTMIWTLLHIPLTYYWKVIVIHCPVPTKYFLISGTFVKNNILNSIFTNIWGIFGFFIPMIILAYCNLKLIHSLHLSGQIRKQKQEGQKRMTNNNTQKLLTVTLVSIVCMFFILVLPSELVYFYGQITQLNSYSQTFRVLTLTSNLFQAINFSMNFVLYCFVNRYFRKTIRNWLSMLPFANRLLRRNSTEDHQMRTRSFRCSVTIKEEAML